MKKKPLLNIRMYSIAYILFTATATGLLQLMAMFRFFENYSSNLMVSENIPYLKSLYYCLIHMDRIVTGDEIKNVSSIENFFSMLFFIHIIKNYKYEKKSNFIHLLAFSILSLLFGNATGFCLVLFVEMFSYERILKPKEEENTKFLHTLIDFIYVIAFTASIVFIASLPEEINPTHNTSDYFPSLFRITTLLYSLIVLFFGNSHSFYFSKMIFLNQKKKKANKTENRSKFVLFFIFIISTIAVASMRVRFYYYATLYFKTPQEILYNWWFTSMRDPMVSSNFHGTFGIMIGSLIFILFSNTRNGGSFLKFICVLLSIFFGGVSGTSFYLLFTNRVFIAKIEERKSKKD